MDSQHIATVLRNVCANMQNSWGLRDIRHVSDESTGCAFTIIDGEGKTHRITITHEVK